MTGSSGGEERAPKRASYDGDDSRNARAVDFLNVWQERTKELVASGTREGHARGLARLELRIAHWPSGWGDDLVVLIYGDFRPPPAALEFPSLGITIEPEPVTASVIKSALCVLKARVKIPERSVKALIDAAARMDTLVGALAVLNWGNSGSGWWSHVTHGSSGGEWLTLDADRVQKVVEALGTLPALVARKVRSAMYWIREPRQLLTDDHRSDVLRLYAGYWNAFECLVEAVCLLRPQPRRGRSKQKADIVAFVAERHGKLDAESIRECYKTFVDPGFVAKASYALEVCFPGRADQYVVECFRMKRKQDRLYDIRNAINHGDVDADNPRELLRIEDRHSRLWMIVFGMLGLMIPIDRPLDHGQPT